MKNSLFKMIGKTLPMLGEALPMLAKLPAGFMFNDAKDYPIRTESSWEEEKEDILERANYLCERIIKNNPEELMQEAPKMIGREFQGEWAIYCCSMLTHALVNISLLYPEEKEKSPQQIAKMIDLVNTPTIREYDTMQWKEDAIESLTSSNKSHMTYISILAWMITNYKFAGGDSRYDNLLHSLCKALNKRMLDSKYDMNLLSFPYKQIWLPDMLVSLVALRMYGKLYDGKYCNTVEKWLTNAKTMWIHKSTGLLAGQLPGQSRRVKGIVVRGSHSGLNASYLTMVDEEFARQQYEAMKKYLRHEASFMGKNVCGVKEYLRQNPDLKMAPGDAGLVIKGISAGGTAFALGAATYFDDWEFRSQMLRTAEVAGGTVKENRKRHYRLAEMFLVGEATALAMRTNVKR